MRLFLLPLYHLFTAACNTLSSPRVGLDACSKQTPWANHGSTDDILESSASAVVDWKYRWRLRHAVHTMTMKKRATTCRDCFPTWGGCSND